MVSALLRAFKLDFLVQAPGKIRKRLDEDGYTMLSGASKWPVNLRSIEQGINKMVAAGWPASFIMMFDEPWLLMHSMAPLMLEGTHEMT